MKKSVKVLISIVLVLALGAAGAFGYLYFTKDKPNNDDTPDSKNPDTAETVNFDSGDYVASANGISIIADDTGVRVFNEADQTQKIIFDRPAWGPLFDGETAYFIEKEIEDTTVELYDDDYEPVSQDEYGPWMREKIYSYNLKTDEIKEVILTNDDNTNLVYVDESNIYYIDANDNDVGVYSYRATSSFYKYDIANQKRTLMLENVGWYCVDKGMLFYQTEAITGTGEDGYHSLYIYDFKSESFKMISKEEAEFMKYEGDEVFFLERICKYGEDYECEDVKFTLKSFNLKNNESKVVAELNFLPDDPRIWASYVDNDNILIYGKEFNEILYNLKDRSYKVVEEEPEKDGYFDTVGLNQLFIETLYAFDEEVQEEMQTGIAIYLCNENDDYKLITKFEDKNVNLSKITENGVYKYTSYYDSDIEAFTPVEIEFVPIEIK